LSSRFDPEGASMVIVASSEVRSIMKRRGPARNAAPRRPARKLVPTGDPFRGGFVGTQVDIDVYSPNPVTEWVIATSGAGFGPEPTMFVHGPTPPYTASGIEPALLLTVP
jgi:hypothetical protein